MIARQITISGDVHGVGYRFFAKMKAKKFGILGWTKNEHDGTVSLFIQGSEEAVTAMIEWAAQGSPMATVTEVQVKEAPVNEGLKGFEVR